MRKSIRNLLITYFEGKNIFITRKRHWNDFALSSRIQSTFILLSPNVLHIGAHSGQEAEFYENCRAQVLWLEANPEQMPELVKNISRFPKQTAKNFLLGDKQEHAVPFFVSENQGASSSIFELTDSALTTAPKLVRQLNLDMYRLEDLFSSRELGTFRHWVLDVQGAELQVLKGAGNLLKCAQSILIEAKRESEYKGGVSWNELQDFLHENGFQNLWEPIDNEEDNILFIRVRN